MKSMKCLTVILLVGLSVYAIPPYMWYGTYSINNYYGNGCPIEYNLSQDNADADEFISSTNDHAQYMTNTNVQQYRNRRDADVTADKWAGAYAEVNYVDFAFYSGHGNGYGAFFGYNTSYIINCLSDCQFHSVGYLKWVQAAACEWFCPPQYCNNLGEMNRWASAFQGIHAIMAHRAITYDSPDPNLMSCDFWDRWVNMDEALATAWGYAQIEWIYENGGNGGLQPAVMGANDGSYGGYMYETYYTAQDEVAPSGNGSLYWLTVGTPIYG